MPSAEGRIVAVSLLEGLEKAAVRMRLRAQAIIRARVRREVLGEELYNEAANSEKNGARRD